MPGLLLTYGSSARVPLRSDGPKNVGVTQDVVGICVDTPGMSLGLTAR